MSEFTEEVNDGIRSILDVIWKPKPAISAPDYLNSFPMQNRILANGNVSKVSSHDTFEIEGNIFPSCMPKQKFVGSYERSFMFNILRENRKKNFFIPYAGGPDSGKSSLTRFLANIIYETFKYCEKDCPSVDSSCAKIFYINLQMTSDEVLEDKKYYSSRKQDFDLRKITIKKLTRLMLNEFMAYVKEDKYCEFMEKALWDTKRDNQGTDELIECCDSLGRSLSAKGYKKQMNVYEKLKMINEGIHEFSDPKDMLRAHLLPMWECAEALGKIVGNTSKGGNERGEKTVKQLIFVLDNIDPLPEDIQEYIAGFFADTVNHEMWKGIKILLPIRLGTLTNIIENVQRSSLYGHETFEPASLVFYKLCFFLIASDSIPSFSSINYRIKNEIINRFLAFWLHLIDKKSYFSSIFSSLTGTNLSFARDIVFSWCKDEMTHFGNNEKNNLVEYKEQIETIVTDSILSEFWDLSINGFGSILKTHTSNIDTRTLKNVDKESLVSEFIATFIEIGKEIRIFCKEGQKAEHNEFEIAHKVIDIIRSKIPTNIEYHIEQNEHEDLFLHRQAQMVINSLLDVLGISDVFKKSGKEKENLKEIKRDCHEFLETLSSVITKYNSKHLKRLISECCRMHNLKEETEISGKICEWINNIFLVTSEMEIEYSCNLFDKDIYPTHVPFVNEIKFQSINRFKACIKLLDTPISIRSKIRPENVFLGAGKRLSTLPLNILYRIYYWDTSEEGYHCIKISDLNDFITTNLNFTDKEFVFALKQLMSSNSQLIYSAGHSSESLDDTIKDSSRMLYLSSSGVAYIEDLIPTPPYIHWSFSKSSFIDGFKEYQESNFIDQIQLVLKGFEEIVRIDFGKIDKMKIDYEESYFSSYITCATLDVYFRSLHHYIITSMQ